MTAMVYVCDGWMAANCESYGDEDACRECRSEPGEQELAEHERERAEMDRVERELLAIREAWVERVVEYVGQLAPDGFPY